MHSWVAQRETALGALALVLCTSVTGCVMYKDHGTHGAPGADGQVQVDWLVGSAGCEASEVTTVAVTIGPDTEEFPCDDGGATLTVPAGTYDVQLQGLDVDNIARYGGDGGVVVVDGDQTTTVPTVVLSSLPASIRVDWYFENAHLCSANGVSDVEVTLFDANDVVQGTSTAPCDDSTVTLTDIEAGGYAVLALGRDADGQEVYSGESQINLLRGDDAKIEITLAAE